MKDNIVSMHIETAMVTISDLGHNASLSIETANGIKTVNVTRSEMIEFLLDSLNLLCVGNK